MAAFIIAYERNDPTVRVERGRGVRGWGGREGERYGEGERDRERMRDEDNERRRGERRRVAE